MPHRRDRAKPGGDRGSRHPRCPESEPFFFADGVKKKGAGSKANWLDESFDVPEVAAAVEDAEPKDRTDDLSRP